MKPEAASYSLMGITRSKAKMFEYGVPIEHHINILRDPSRLFSLTIGMLGDATARANRGLPQVDGAEHDHESGVSFSAQFFDAYLASRLEPQLDDYLAILASASFYLSDLPGSAAVMASKPRADFSDFDSGSLLRMLRWILVDSDRPHTESTSHLATETNTLARAYEAFRRAGAHVDQLTGCAHQLRAAAYATGTPRELLLADTIVAVILKKVRNSVWSLLPAFSGLPRETSFPVLQRRTGIRELWPSQILVGEQGVLRGANGILQMPTSAGKTKATELIIRSAFLSERSGVAVIVAPFRALCSEITTSMQAAFEAEDISVNQISDLMRADFEMNEVAQQKKILVVTPEKLMFLIRQQPLLPAQIGLIIYDEAHQFGSGRRGVIYELLLASLRLLIPETSQSVLISAVIKNAGELAQWIHRRKSPTLWLARSHRRSVQSHSSAGSIRWGN